MVVYEDQTLFPAARVDLWRLLDAHLDDTRISSIHPLIRSQRTVRTEDGARILERTIDARGRLLTSTWKLTYRPPDWSRWEVVRSEGPWAEGSFVETSYTDAPGGTRLETTGELKITVLPFLIPQRGVVRRVMDDVDAEDRAFLSRL